MHFLQRVMYTDYNDGFKSVQDAQTFGTVAFFSKGAMEVNRRVVLR